MFSLEKGGKVEPKPPQFLRREDRDIGGHIVYINMAG
jgi:hypothetical protein